MYNQPLDEWIAGKIEANQTLPLCRDKLVNYQVKKINETLDCVIKNSPFYKEKYKRLQGFTLNSLMEINDLPFTTTGELVNQGLEMLCVPAGSISRIVSLKTSGTTGPAKRIYFTEEDQELTIDYFHNGMKNLVTARDTVLILLACHTPGNVGDLLEKGLKRLGANVIPYGFPQVVQEDVLKELCEIIRGKGVTSMVGSPKEALSLAEFTEKDVGQNQIKTVLLSTDYVSDNLRQKIKDLWGAKVYEHYGSTEMGLGGAVSCHVLTGYHPRENDLYFEIIDLKTGKPAKEGEYGEVVFTTLTRKGMPLIRYKTGDISRWIPGPCPCGSPLKRMDKVLPHMLTFN